MKIGIDIRALGKNRTGDEVVFLNLTRELAQIDTQNEYCLFIDTRTEKELRSIADRLGISGNSRFRFVSLPAKNKFDWNLMYAPRAIMEESLDVYHTQYFVPFFVSRRTKIVTHVHDISFRVFPRLISMLDRVFLTLLLPQSLARADAIVAVSEFTKAELLKYYRFLSPEKITVVPNAVDPYFAESGTDERMAFVRSKYSLPETYILYVGTFQPRKNLPVLLQAFAEARKRAPKLSLVLVGNRHGYHADPHIDETIEKEGLADSVCFPGFVDAEDLPKVFRGARAFAYPSLYEGFGIPILEAMTVGTPAIASDIPSLREVGGDAATFFDPKDIAAFSDSLYTVSTMEGYERTAILEKGFERSRFFSWKKSAEILLQLYGRLSSLS